MTSRPGIITVLLCLALFGGFAGYRMEWWQESPQDAWEDVTTAATNGDYGAIWDRFDLPSQGRMAASLLDLAESITPHRAASMTDRERYILLLETRPGFRTQFIPSEVLSVRRVGDMASLELDRVDSHMVFMTRQNSRWCLSYGASQPR